MKFLFGISIGALAVIFIQEHRRRKAIEDARHQTIHTNRLKYLFVMNPSMN